MMNTVGCRRNACKALIMFMAALAFFFSAPCHALDNWKPYPPGAQPGGPWGGSVRHLVPLSPIDSSVVYAATGGGVYRSTDGGRNWEARNNGLATLDVTDVAVCASESSALLAATAFGGLYKSIDGGANWTRLTVLNGFVPVTMFGAVAIDPNDINHMFAGSRDTGTTSNNYFESTNGGQTWTKILSPASVTITRMQFAYDGSSVLYFSSTSGKIYKHVPGNFPAQILTVPAILGVQQPVNDFHLMDPAGGKIALAAEKAGFVVATYNEISGTYILGTFRKVLDPKEDIASGVSIAALSISPDLDTISFPGGRLLMYYYDRNGNTLSALYRSLDNLATDPVKINAPEAGMYVNDILILSDADLLAENISGVFRRSDKNMGVFSWSSQGMSAYPVADFDFAPTGSDATLGLHRLSVSGGGKKPKNGNAGIVQWSPDGGGSWVRRSGSGAVSGGTRLIKYRTDTSLWMSVAGFTFYKSTDGGATWTLGGMDDTDPATNDVYGMEFGGTNAILMSGSGVVYYSLNGGGRWTRAGGLPDSRSYLLGEDVANYGGFYAASTGSGASAGVFSTLNFGVSWGRIDGTYYSDKAIFSFETSRQVDGHLLVGTEYFGLFESFDSGSTWNIINDGEGGLPLTGQISNVALGPAVDDILEAVSVTGDGIYLTGDGGVTWTRVSAGLELGDFSMPEIESLKFAPDGKSLVAGIDGLGLYYLELGSMPELTNSGPFTATAQRQYVLTLTGTDPDGSQVTFEAVDIPATATFMTDTLRWTPATSDIGLHQLVFTISDGFYSRPYTLDLTVIASNDPPVFDLLGDQEAVVGSQFTLTVQATDPDGLPQPVSYSAAGLPAGATMTGATFTWTPLPFQAGDHTVSFLATDGRETTSMPVTISVNSPPVLQSPGDQNGKLYAVKDVPLEIRLIGADPDAGDRIFFWADGLMLPDNIYTFTPTQNSEVKTVAFTVQDSHLTFGNTVNLTIETSASPDIVPPAVFNYLPAQVVNVGDTLAFTMVLSADVRQLPVTLEATGLPTGADFDILTGEFTWTPSVWVEPIAVTINAYQDGLLFPIATRSVTLNVNQPPVLLPVTSVVGTVGETKLLSVSASDPDSDAFTYLAANLPPGAAIDPASGGITWVVQATDPRTTTAILYAYDALGGWSTTGVDFTTNHAPTLAAVSDKTVVVDSPLSFSLSGGDHDLDTLIYSADGLPLGSTFNTANGAFSWTPDSTTGSPFAVTFRVTDVYGAFATRATSITVTPKPKPPSGGGGGGGGGCFISTIGER